MKKKKKSLRKRLPIQMLTLRKFPGKRYETSCTVEFTSPDPNF